MKLFVSCAIGLEPVLADELAALFERAVKPTTAGVWVETELSSAYRAALWSRVASRVLLPIFKCEAKGDDLYHAAIEQH